MAILDGPPPTLPPPQESEEPLRFGGDTHEGNAWIGDLDDALVTLDELRTKKLATFADTCVTPDQIKTWLTF